MGIIAHDTTLSSHISSRCGAPANFDQNDPQSFNLYSYVENNPLSGIDPNGRNVTICTWINHSDGSMSQSCQTINGDAYKAALDAQMIANSKNSPYNGVQAPGGDRPNGIITCDGQACGTVSWSPDPSPDEGQAIPTMFPMDVIAFGGGAKLGSDIVDAFVGLGAEDAGRTVIGRVWEINGPLQEGESRLDLPDLGNPKANWAQNSSRLREAMAQGKPIRDLHADEFGNLLSHNYPNGGGAFLRAERDLLQNHGWTYDQGTSSWYPPQ